MKHLGPLLAGGLTLIIVLVVGLFSFLPADNTAQAVEAPAGDTAATQIVVPAPPEAGQLEAVLAEREAMYQAQLQELDQTLQERQAAYQAQLQTLAGQATAAQNQLAELQAQEQEMSAQLANLQNTRNERLATYQAQLQQAQNQYTQRYTQLQTQLAEARNRLAEANAQLGK